MGVVDMRVGSYGLVSLWSDAGCKAEKLEGRPATVGKFATAEACLPEVLSQPACVSGIFMHEAASGNCACCTEAQRDGIASWASYKVKGWTTLRAYRKPEAIATWKMGTFLSTIPNGANLDMFFEDDGS